MGVWPEIADGTDVNACDVSEELRIVAVADDFGRVRIYRFPNAQSESESLELLGHSSHVTGVTFLPGLPIFLYFLVKKNNPKPFVHKNVVL
jgi:microtubule-associated protein-like 1/2